jgi:hypothetical protein
MENVEQFVYEAPQLVEVGDYSELTMGVGFPFLDLFVAFD